MAHDRPQRVGQLIQEELGRLAVRGFKDPRIGFVTFTGVKVSPDLREAWVYWAVHGDERARKSTAEGLAAAAGFVRRHIGQQLQLRHTPEVHFVYDEAIDRGQRVEELLREIKQQDDARDRGDENE
jgi:ribosome-binding factor A